MSPSWGRRSLDSYPFLRGYFTSVWFFSNHLIFRSWLLMQVISIALRGQLCSDEVLDSARSDSTHLPCFDESTSIIRVLLRYFKVGIWSNQGPDRLTEAVQLLLPPDILSEIIFLYPSKSSERPSYCHCLKMFKEASTCRQTGLYLRPECVVFADLDPFGNPRKGIVHYMSYLSVKTRRIGGICRALRLE